jgi:hypothetical protein
VLVLSLVNSVDATWNDTTILEEQCIVIFNTTMHLRLKLKQHEQKGFFLNNNFITMMTTLPNQFSIFLAQFSYLNLSAASI